MAPLVQGHPNMMVTMMVIFYDQSLHHQIKGHHYKCKWWENLHREQNRVHPSQKQDALLHQLQWLASLRVRHRHIHTVCVVAFHSTKLIQPQLFGDKSHKLTFRHLWSYDTVHTNFQLSRFDTDISWHGHFFWRIPLHWRWSTSGLGTVTILIERFVQTSQLVAFLREIGFSEISLWLLYAV